MRALISVSDKKGIVEFVHGLVNLGYEIISTGGTLWVLTENGIAATAVEEITGIPEMMDGRVKTLHPKIHGALLGLRDNAAHMAAMKSHDITPIDLVVVNLYPFEKTISKTEVALEEAIENIDIGGPSMLRSASKNFRSVGVIVNPDRYSDLLIEMKANAGELSYETKAELAVEAFQHTARYDAIISDYLAKNLISEPDTETLPGIVSPILSKVMDLRYGENPHQRGAFYQIQNQKGLPNFIQLHGKELSYNNIMDMDAAWCIAKSFELPAAAVIKHSNPCGTAIGDDVLSAYTKAYDADPVSAFGGIVGVNRPVDLKTAEEMGKIFLEVIIAPDFDKDALALLTKKQNIRLIKMPEFFVQEPEFMYKYVTGGMLMQSADTRLVTKADCTVPTTAQPTTAEWNDLLFGYTVVKFVKSNAILITKGEQTIGAGAGQTSRIDSVKIALEKAGDKAKGAVVASDAFFPFRDCVDMLAAAGVKAIIQPGGSMRDQESIDACNEHGIAMVFTGVRHFRH